ncbi:MAG: ATP-binding cassette domain-containing protein [Theionarchaea archaeon]|nr:ATP-binding cassette domain-containing protein [Theionarchaea archaeon]
MNPDPVVVRNISFSYPNKRGIHDVTFSVSEGEVLCIFGKNGSGKTTLLKVLSTLYRPQQGTLLVCGFDAIRRREKARKTFLKRKYSFLHGFIWVA